MGVPHLGSGVLINIDGNQRRFSVVVIKCEGLGAVFAEPEVTHRVTVRKRLAFRQMKTKQSPGAIFEMGCAMWV